MLASCFFVNEPHISNIKSRAKNSNNCSQQLRIDDMECQLAYDGYKATHACASWS